MATENQDRKILVRSWDNYLIKVNLSSGKTKRLVYYDHHLYGDCSFSPPIKNRYVYVVGGSSLNSYYYDLKNLQAGVLQLDSPLCFKTFEPTLILLGSKLFAFQMGDVYLSEPKCQYLDTDSVPLQWCLLETSPVLPGPPPEDIRCYNVITYAVNVNSNDIFLSLGDDTTSLAGCYNDISKRWSKFSKTPLPFVGQGQFVGLVCYGFPKTYGRSDHSWYLSAYNLNINWKDDAEVYCVEMYRYSLVCSYPDPCITSYLYHIFPTTVQNKLVIVRGAKGRGFQGKILTLEVDTFRLQNHHYAIPLYQRLNQSLGSSSGSSRSAGSALESSLQIFPAPPAPPTPSLTRSSRSSGGSRVSEAESSPQLFSAVSPSLTSGPSKVVIFSEPDRPLFSTQVLNHQSSRLCYALRDILGEFNQ